jgi:hypothetical protein
MRDVCIPDDLFVGFLGDVSDSDGVDVEHCTESVDEGRDAFSGGCSSSAQPCGVMIEAPLISYPILI